ncbi:hypothetical protein FZEAL_6489 [Fusarium zealandicum]|uniref:BZIP domain-containing protein n=1 Tax=Fusarium zealandicum TaxID=1053134 RepID=A0A8H4UHP4_9HYPO|nr:hypothetical protein FZEAL_6489 [Fusarium zealandicum]
MTESPQLAPESLPTRKRAKSSEENEEDRGKKRSRGRPRLDTKDESAQDRRRTQIRLAQRAYRNRKDTAITSLEQKVKDLENANENMGREFMSFFDFVLAQGMLESAPEMARRLNDTTRKFLSYTRKSTEDAPKDTCVTPPLQKTTEPDVRPQESQDSRSSSSSSPGEGLAEPNPPAPRVSPQETNLATPPRIDEYSQQQPTPPLNLPYEIITMPTAENASFPVYDTQAPPALNNNPFIPSPFTSLPSPSSYAPQERTFGRRLQRATVEAGLRLVSMANPPPHRYASVFGFCLLFEPRESIIRRLARVLTKPRQETLFHWQYPFANLGGAGTFFSADGGSGSQPGMNSVGGGLPIGNQGLLEPSKPAEMNGFSMGPFEPDVETARDDRLDYRMRMMYKGFEGDFFDPDEIEAYLRQRGIVIPENADFIDAEIDPGALDETPSFQSNAGSNGFFGGTQPPAPGPDLYSMPSHNVPSAGNMWPDDVPTTLAAGTSSIPAASLMAPSMGHDMGSFMPQIQPPGAQQLNLGIGSFMDASYFPRAWPGSSWMKTKVTIDVNRLVAEMTSMAICLGRTPGLRPADVNKAVKAAIALSGH